MAMKICNRLKLSNDEKDKIVRMNGVHMNFIGVKTMKESTLKKFVRQDNFAEMLALHRADRMGGSMNIDIYYLMVNYLGSLKPEAVRPPRLITGHDLIAAGYEPGPAFKEILNMIEELQLDGIIATREEALAFVCP
jgi:hypothetical protein